MLWAIYILSPVLSLVFIYLFETTHGTWSRNNLVLMSVATAPLGISEGCVVNLTGEGNSTQSSTLAWKIPWTEEPGRLQSTGSQRVGHDWATSLSLFTFHFHALEKEMATHSSVLSWRIPGMEEPGGLPSMGSHRVGHDWNDLAAAVNLTCQFILCSLFP